MPESYCITFWFPGGGFGIEYYEFPADKNQADLDVLNHLKNIINLLRDGPSITGKSPSEMLQTSIRNKEIVPPISLEKLRNKYIQKERFNNP